MEDCFLSSHDHLDCGSAIFRAGLSDGKRFRHLFSMDSAREVPAEFQAQQAPEALIPWNDLSARAHEKTQKTPEGTLIIDTQKARPFFKLDPETDPLLISSSHVVEDPAAILKASKEDTRTTKHEKIRLTCEEGGEPVLLKRTRTLLVEVAEKKRIFMHTRIYGYNRFYNNPYDYTDSRELSPEHKEYTTPGFNALPGSDRGDGLHTVTPIYRYERCFPNENPQEITKEVYENSSLDPADIREKWIPELDPLEADVDSGRCAYIEKMCTQGPQTRIIQGFPIERPCWQETYTYACQNDVENTCAPLRAKGCVQISSTCVERQEERCLHWRQTYECETEMREDGKVSLSGEGLSFCLDGNCDEHLHGVNKDFAEAMTRLSVFKEMDKDMDPQSLHLFQGRDARCSRNFASFRDCCGGRKGWGISLGLANCDMEEKALFEERLKGKCHEIGEYCAEKVLGVCIRKKRTYCCFQSKLARLVNTQGRAQLGLSWGSPKNPICRGLTVDEMQRVNFDHLDLSELYEEIVRQKKTPDFSKVQKEITQKFKAKKFTQTTSREAPHGL